MCARVRLCSWMCAYVCVRVGTLFVNSKRQQLPLTWGIAVAHSEQFTGQKCLLGAGCSCITIAAPPSVCSGAHPYLFFPLFCSWFHRQGLTEVAELWLLLKKNRTFFRFCLFFKIDSAIPFHVSAAAASSASFVALGDAEAAALADSGCNNKRVSRRKEHNGLLEEGWILRLWCPQGGGEWWWRRADSALLTERSS